MLCNRVLEVRRKEKREPVRLSADLDPELLNVADSGHDWKADSLPQEPEARLRERDKLLLLLSVIMRSNEAELLLGRLAFSIHHVTILLD